MESLLETTNNAITLMENGTNGKIDQFTWIGRVDAYIFLYPAFEAVVNKIVKRAKKVAKVVDKKKYHSELYMVNIDLHEIEDFVRKGEKMMRDPAGATCLHDRFTIMKTSDEYTNICVVLKSLRKMLK